MKNIPEYLAQYVTQQDPSLYTPIDHASWRFIMQVSKSYFSKHAHEKYLNGLKETGISIERIPLIEEMAGKLAKFNWHAVAVSGFIPPSAFMEFLSLGILPIACEMRSLQHMAYTPAPDIVHEAAGHAPIIADPEYADYLRSYGEISRKAIYSTADLEVYDAIRHLSVIKEDPNASYSQIDAAQARLDHKLASVTYVSEASQLARMGWWTFEYGLVGSLLEPKIFGAGLLSSLGESYHCFEKQVKKIPFSINCIDVAYDITQPQPQLFVTENFQKLKQALLELSNRMAFRTGGVSGLEKAKKAGTLTTVQLDTGVQISGNLVSTIEDSSGIPRYLQFKGPTQLSVLDSEIPGHGCQTHADGYGTPVEDLSGSDLKKAGVIEGKKGHLRFSSGISVEGKCKKILTHEDRPILISFEDCTVKHGTHLLFQPEWGTYDMVCGGQVVSVFGGAADRKKYKDTTEGKSSGPRKQKTNLTEENRELGDLYQVLRTLREKSIWEKQTLAVLNELYEAVQRFYPSEWLIRYELLELVVRNQLKVSWEDAIRARLSEISKDSSEKGEMIKRGLELL